MKIARHFIALVMVFQVLFTHGQASLDAYNTFDDITPAQGWTMALNVNPGGEYYSTGSDNSPSARLDATGEYVLVAFAEKPASVSYFIRSTGIGEPVAPGTIFTVQQSVNGFSWTNLRVLNESNLNGDFTQFTDQVADNARFIRFYYTFKASGSNIALDELLVQKALPSDAACLMIYRNGEKVLSGSMLEFSGNESVILEFTNEGLSESLDINAINWSGLNATEFSFSSMPSNISAQSSQLVELLFTGESGQQYEASFSVLSNDEYNPQYAVNCIGYGGSYAPEPISSLQNFIASNVSTWSFDLSWMSGIPTSDGVIVFQRADAPVSVIPMDGVVYNTGDYNGTDKVVYAGAGNAFTPKFISASRTYHYAVFPYNGEGNYRNYKQSNPLTGQVSTPNNAIGNYYSGVSAHVPSFVSDLSNKLFPHNQLLYDDYSSFLIDEFEVRDTTNSKRGVTDYYTGYEYTFEGSFTWDVLSREHVFPHSWFASYPAFEAIEYSDYHNLFPVHNDSANLVRSNHPLGVVQNPVQTFYNGKLGYNVLGNLVYEPRDESKGRAARAMFYMLACYNNQVAGAWQLAEEQDQQLLKTWHFQNPPTRREMSRNDYIHSIQGNRNAFVDSVHFACYIDFSNMTYIANPPAWCVALSSDYEEKNWLNIYPNPSSGLVNINTQNVESNLLLELFDISGKMLWSEVVRAPGQNHILSFTGVESGTYLLRWSHDSAVGQKQLIFINP